jgi:hypothetical protein
MLALPGSHPAIKIEEFAVHVEGLGVAGTGAAVA